MEILTKFYFQGQRNSGYRFCSTYSESFRGQESYQWGARMVHSATHQHGDERRANNIYAVYVR
jgi:hypothetical protein